MLSLISNQKVRTEVAKKLRTYFNISKARFEEALDLTTPVMVSLDTELLPLDNPIYAVKSNSRIPAELFFNYRKLENSSLYEEFLNAEGMLEDPVDMLMVIMIGSSFFVMYRASSYSGLGGLFTMNDKADGFVFEPLNNFLNSTHPKEILD